ncbi:hypothetical protein Cgig2_031432 [Carnegiea gigantea]|uniref:Uncharacterized protein n=1 Tax=Carnegiea gigantea TaxID=171969 RepID=A0A9Q1K7R9_9CARY|nr:hypothetical protein Cgig2_031432 [Carnegiea gigantea]
MGIDVNDVKMFINGGFQYLIKTCRQWAKDHPFVSGVLLFFYLLYIFFPYLFSMLFYTFPSKTAEGISKHQANKEGFPSPLPTGDDPTIHKILEEEIIPMKMNKEKFLSDSLNLASEKTLSSTTSSDSDSEEENNKPQEKSDNLVEWTEDDQRNLMDLGSSEIERNKRLESLIAKRRARKLLSMQPRRTNFEYLGSHMSFDDHIYQVGVIARAFDDGSGSTPSIKLRTRNPFDLPYDPHEEKPVLTGDSFEEDLFPNVKKEARLCRHESFRLGGANSLGEHPLAKSLPSFFLKKPCFTQFQPESDVEENTEIPGGLSRGGNDPDPKPDRQELPREVQLRQTQCVRHDQPITSPPGEGNHQKFENETFVQNDDPTRLGSTSSTEGKKEKELEAKDNEDENIHIKSDATIVRDDDQLPQDPISKNKEQDDGEDSSSSSSSSTEIHVNATKNEAFRNSVKKVLTCLVLNPRSTGLQGKESLGASSSDPLQDSSPVAVLSTEMDERSLYTTQRHHSQTFSIASDMQVEVSETGSPTSGPPDPNSPTDRESLVYDGDVDKDANSGDEDLWAASPHPMRLGDMGTKFRLPDIIEESSNRASEFGIAHNADDPPILSGALEEEAVQARGVTALSLSPRSILPEESRQEVVDQKSTNGDIIEPRSSSSSSPLSSSSRSKGLDSQMQGKSEHLAEYLANLPPSETGSNTLEDPGPSHVHDTSAEVISILDESHSIFEMEEDKEESKESKLSEESQENSEETTSTSQLEAPKEACSTCEEHIKDDLIKKHDPDQAVFIAEQNDHPRRLEVRKCLLKRTYLLIRKRKGLSNCVPSNLRYQRFTLNELEQDGPKATTEEDISLREPLGHENEVIFGSLASGKEDTIDQSKSIEQPSNKLDKDVTVVSGNQTQNEVITASPRSSIIQASVLF